MFEINEFVERDVPDVTDWNSNSWKQFKSDLDFFVTQMTLDVIFRDRRESVKLSTRARDRIRGHVFGLRECVRSANLSERKRAAPLDKLDAFEVEIDRSRVSILAVARVTVEVLALGGGAWQAVEIAQRLVSNVIQEVAAAKAEDDESRRLPPYTAQPAMLTAPRRVRSQRGSTVPAFEEEAGGMDEDIPF